jgi:diguanylate cyclase (GGDEF)-like protein
VGGTRIPAQQSRVIGYFLLISLVAVIATVVAAIKVPVTLSDARTFGLLAATGIAQAELGRQVERVRQRNSGAMHINLTSVWFLPAALLLPPVLVAALVALLTTHLHVRSWYRAKQVPALRTAGNIGVITLVCYATKAAVVASGTDLAGAIIIGIPTYFVANIALAVPVRRPVRTAIGSGLENVFELATLCLGGFTALALATLPRIAVLMVVPVFILHRAVLVNQLESAARQDSKTDVLNSAGWHRLAHLEKTRAERDGTARFAVLMADLDHFKKINDGYGHLAGDAVLQAVAGLIKSTVRDRDPVGRFGGEEFVVLLCDTAESEARVVAERIRVAISRLQVTFRERTIRGLSVSIGVAMYPVAGVEIEELLHAADAAMYRAKRNGRNQVVA